MRSTGWKPNGFCVACTGADFDQQMKAAREAMRRRAVLRELAKRRRRFDTNAPKQ